MPRHRSAVDAEMARTSQGSVPSRRRALPTASRGCTSRAAGGPSREPCGQGARSAPNRATGVARYLQQRANGAERAAVVPSVDPGGYHGVALHGVHRDYMPSEVELGARLREESEIDGVHVLRVGRIALDLAGRRLEAGGQVFMLTHKQFSLLRLFMSHAGQILTRKQIMKEVWETDYTGDTRTLDVHVHSVRKLLGDVPGKPKYLQTVRRVGYRFVDPSGPGEGPRSG